MSPRSKVGSEVPCGSVVQYLSLQLVIKPENCCGLSEWVIRTLVRDIASAIEYIHAVEIVHRDIKPENIVIQKQDSKVSFLILACMRV